MRLRRTLTAVSVALIAASLAGPAVRAQDAAAPPTPVPPIPASPADAPDTGVMAKLRDEEMNRSQVMPTVLYLTDVIGQRLTGSQGQKKATLWTVDEMKNWGFSNVHVEPWGPFGRGWDLERFSAQVIEPVCIPLIADPKSWTPGLRKPIEVEAVYLDVKTAADLAKYKGTLKGKAVLFTQVRPLQAHFEPIGTRYTDEDLVKLTQPFTPGRRRFGGPGGPGGPGAPGTPPAPGTPAAPGTPPAPGTPGTPPPAGPGGPGGGPGGPFAARFREQQQLVSAINQMMKEEGAAIAVDASRGDGGTIFAQSASVLYGTDVAQDQRHAVWEKDAPEPALPQIILASEHYNRIVRMLQAGQKVKLAVDLQVDISDSEKDGLVGNTVAEIPGGDKAGEVVMCGAHLDSWHAGTGATDNAAGCAVCMEAMRLLKTLGVTPRRTIRMALWTGEEEGLYGSEAYAKQHFGTRDKVLPEQAKVSAYFNLDNGTGKVRGIYAQGNSDVMPIFNEWLKPFNDLGATTVTIRNTGSTDHVSFDRMGVPGFQFIQDEIEYETRTHHSNQDVYDRLQADDLKQASLLLAAFLYDAAMRDGELPRKPFPPPEQDGGGRRRNGGAPGAPAAPGTTPPAVPPPAGP